jgi:acetyltransferase-like isoleucine patch superfamily enzyme
MSFVMTASAVLCPDTGADRAQALAPRLAHLRKAVKDPIKAVRVLWWLTKGFWYKWTYRLRGVRFTAGRNFRVQGRLNVRGPGQVVFGDNVVVGAYTTPWTHSANAMIKIGNGTFLNGTRFGAVTSITIGADCMIADAHLLDTDFHTLNPNRRDPRATVRSAAINIANNVWVAGQAGILPGVVVGNNSVVGYGAICLGQYPANCLIAGNPAKIVRHLRSEPGTPELITSAM